MDVIINTLIHICCWHSGSCPDNTPDQVRFHSSHAPHHNNQSHSSSLLPSCTSRGSHWSHSRCESWVIPWHTLGCSKMNSRRIGGIWGARSQPGALKSRMELLLSAEVVLSLFGECLFSFSVEIRPGWEDLLRRKVRPLRDKNIRRQSESGCLCLEQGRKQLYSNAHRRISAKVSKPGVLGLPRSKPELRDTRR